MRRTQRQAQVFVPYEAAEVMAAVYGTCRVVEAEPTERGLRFTLEGEAHVIEKIERAVCEVQS